MEEYAKNRITYSNHFIAFLDALGFKQMVFGGDKSDIEDYFGLVKHVTTKLEGIKEQYKLKAIIISDSVILSIPYGDEPFQRIANLKHLCVAIGKIQYTLAAKNIWLRGGISSGESYFNYSENLVVGPAYVNAYLLEENVSVFPRVVLDNKIIGDLELESKQELVDLVNEHTFSNWQGDILYNWKKKPLESMVLKQDVPLFVDYFSPLFKNIHEAHVVINNIAKKIYLNNTVYSKYRWVIDYLISHCNNLMIRSDPGETKTLYKNFYSKLNSL